MKKTCMLFLGILLIILSNMGCALIPNIIPCDSNKNKLFPPKWIKRFPNDYNSNLIGKGDTTFAFEYQQIIPNPAPQSKIDSIGHISDSLKKIYWQFRDTCKILEKKWIKSHKLYDSIKLALSENQFDNIDIMLGNAYKKEDSLRYNKRYGLMDTIYINKNNGEIIKDYTWKERRSNILDSFDNRFWYETVPKWKYYSYEWDSTIRKLNWDIPNSSGTGDKNIFGMLWELIVGCSFAKTKLVDYKGYKIALKNKEIDWGNCEKYYLRIYKGIKYFSKPLINHQIKGYIIDSNSLYIFFVDSSAVLQCYNFEDMIPKK